MKVIIDANSVFKRLFFAKFYVKKGKKFNRSKFQDENFYYSILGMLIYLSKKLKVDRSDMILVYDLKQDNEYFRHDIISDYKKKSTEPDENHILLTKMFNELHTLLRKDILSYLYPILEYPRLEADDVVYIITQNIDDDEFIVVTHDKDYNQMAKRNVQIFNPSLGNYIEITDMNYVKKHIILGDDSDGIPSIFKNTHFTDDFIKHLKENGVLIEDVYLVEKLEIFKHLCETYDNPGKSFYKKSQYRIGDKTLAKNFESILAMVKSDPLLSEHYDRNDMLINLKNIPTEFINPVLFEYKKRDTFENNKISVFMINNNFKKLLISNVTPYDII